jgi:hypothetical protein
MDGLHLDLVLQFYGTRGKSILLHKDARKKIWLKKSHHVNCNGIFCNESTTLLPCRNIAISSWQPLVDDSKTSAAVKEQLSALSRALILYSIAARRRRRYKRVDSATQITT